MLLPFLPMVPSLPSWPDSRRELTNQVRIDSSVIVVGKSIEGASSNLFRLVKFSLHDPQHFCVAGLKAHLPCPGKRVYTSLENKDVARVTACGKLVESVGEEQDSQGG